MPIKAGGKGSALLRGLTALSLRDDGKRLDALQIWIFGTHHLRAMNRLSKLPLSNSVGTTLTTLGRRRTWQMAAADGYFRSLQPACTFFETLHKIFITTDRLNRHSFFPPSHHA